MTDIIVDVIENPYHKAETKPHYLNVAEARMTCFEAFNIVTASQALGGEYEMADEEDPEPTSLFRLHHALAEPRLSELLLQIAVFVRTFDDVMTDLDPEAYRAHAAATNGENYIGDLDGTPLSLREACNKIIHAVDFRPVYDHSDRQVADGSYKRVWYMTGEIEIGGMRGQHQWAVLLFVQPFLEVVVDRIDFTSAASQAGRE
ncbi:MULTISPECIES: hypothetical protein [Brevundimonas]|jgi:hypothetical protein|uniref:hypothetical protein n=1 Tax=unclassified Brevundimonas TaxID=2622653 RepID=UPI0025C1A23F|nr:MULTISPECIES: hypothetical protein [Brevundimonas]